MEKGRNSPYITAALRPETFSWPFLLGGGEQVGVWKGHWFRHLPAGLADSGHSPWKTLDPLEIQLLTDLTVIPGQRESPALLLLLPD